MRTMMIIVMLMGFGLTSKAGTDTLVVESTVVCGMCKSKVEDNIKFEKGVRFVEVDLESKEIMVIYNPDKTDAEAIRSAIVELGYGADDLVADPEAYEDLPGCCKLDSECNN